MRRSFGPKMGGGGGRGMMKTVHRAVRTGMGSSSGSQESYKSNVTTNQQTTTLSLSSNNNNNITNTSSLPCSYLNHPAPDAPTHRWAFTTACDEVDWEYVDDGGSDGDGDSVNGSYDDFVYGSVPSQDEVHHALSSLQEVVEPGAFGKLLKTYGSDDGGVSSTTSSFRKGGSELDWSEPSMQLCYSTSALQGHGSDKVFDALHLLQTEPSVKKMVLSLSSDKAVWDAVMNNKVVRELRESVEEDKSIYDGLDDGVDDSNPVAQVLRWIFVNTKDRVIEIVEKITKVVNELVWPVKNDEMPKTEANIGLNSFEEKLRSSFFLSIVVLLIVVVTRSGKC